jgi:hypothetical protein
MIKGNQISQMLFFAAISNTCFCKQTWCLNWHNAVIDWVRWQQLFCLTHSSLLTRGLNYCPKPKAEGNSSVRGSNKTVVVRGTSIKLICYTLSYLMLSNLISFPVFSFTGLSRPTYKLFLNLYPTFLPFQ